MHVEGPWDELSEVHRLLLENTMLSEQQMQRFTETGQLLESVSASASENIICQCLSIASQAIESAIAHGAATLEELSESTGATTVCGGCTSELASMVGSTSAWQIFRHWLVHLLSPAKSAGLVLGQFVRAARSVWLPGS